MATGSGKRQRWQITGYVPQDEQGEFQAYARSLGIDASSLLVLLIQRAGRVGLDEQRIQEVSNRAVSGSEKITAHFVTKEVHERAVSALAGLPGDLNQSRLCCVLVRLELEEHWLARELGVDSA